MPNTKSDKVLWPINGCGDIILSSGQRTVVTSATLNGCHIFHLMYYLNWTVLNLLGHTCSVKSQSASHYGWFLLPRVAMSSHCNVYLPFCGITLFMPLRSTKTTRQSNQEVIADNNLCLFTSEQSCYVLTKSVNFRWLCDFMSTLFRLW